LQKAAEKNWYLFMEHDAYHEIISVKEENNRFSIKKETTLNNLK